ncbi:hypothetical protein Vadar_001682 [Vaccinium darrowii]|uniref:Uncharacterized protein n=1 Tax=Vaccinium darrowii TaxID=229202 RepID=A0ACB7Y5F7_9ERIC|nr:hypothetical protein Vadar_001682 [Vaccinium darrowii]
MARYSRFISQTLLSRYSTPTCQNPKLLIPKNVLLSDSSTNFVREYSSPSEQTASSLERVSAIVDEISGLTLLEVADLTEVLRKKLDIKEMPVMAVMMPGMGFGGMAGRGGGAAAKGEEKVVVEKTAFDLKLEGGYDAGAKIKIIKEVRACTDLGDHGIIRASSYWRTIKSKIRKTQACDVLDAQALLMLSNRDISRV